MRDLAGGGALELPPHLAGLPECLHKYGPMLSEPPAPEQPAGASAA